MLMKNFFKLEIVNDLFSYIIASSFFPRKLLMSQLRCPKHPPVDWYGKLLTCATLTLSGSKELISLVLGSPLRAVASSLVQLEEASWLIL